MQGSVRPAVADGSLETAARSRCMCVSVGAASYGLSLENVQEVIGVRAVTLVFHAPSALAGIINLRGEVLPIVDLPVLLGSGAHAAKSSEARIVVVRELSGAKRRAGLRVDALLGLVDVPAVGLTAVPSSVSPAIRALLVGVISTSPPCAVLSVSSLLGAPELSALTDTQASQ